MEFQGEWHKVTSIDWFSDGTVYSVVFYPDGKFQMAFNAGHKEEGFRDSRLLLDFEKRLKWGESVAGLR